jgi:molybdopterin molybdotransferase
MPEPTTPLAERPWEDVEQMLDVDSALCHVLAAFSALSPEAAPLLEAAGRVLSEDVVARDNVPPFRNSAMDGYAVRAKDTTGATWGEPIVLPVYAHVAAGQAEVPPLVVGQAIRIMTGAPLPAGADAVVRFEETDASAGAKEQVRIFRPVKRFDNVREAGEDIPTGAKVLGRGHILGPPDLGLLASVGHGAVNVHRRPRVSILSTGDEVVMPHLALTDGKIRDSNSFVLGAMAKSWGAEVRLHGIARDTIADLTGRLGEASGADLIVTSGGVSLGDFDFVKDVLRSEGEIAIWQVRMKPGKPLAFGMLGETPLLGLPGNPVAAAVSFLVFGRPAIRRMLGVVNVEPPKVRVTTAEPIDNRGHRRHYVRVRLSPRQNGPAVATIAGEQGAGVLSSLAAADALLVVPEHMEKVPAGAILEAIPLDWSALGRQHVVTEDQ